jgi:hypothetical protein
MNTRWFWVSEGLLLSANTAIFQQYHGENKVTFRRDDDGDDGVRFVPDQHAWL